MSIQRKIDVAINLSINELASEFCDLDCDMQARFFNIIAKNGKEWWPMQLQSITDSALLGDDARHLMRMIGEYSEKQS